MNDPETQQMIIGLTACLVGGYISQTKVAPTELPGLIASVRLSLAGPEALTTLSSEVQDTLAMAEPQALPDGVTIENSVQPGHIVSLITGGKFQSLKRHLRTHGMTPATYRTRFGLPADYPMVCATYSAHRQQLAKDQGLGTSKMKPATDSVTQVETEGAAAESKKPVSETLLKTPAPAKQSGRGKRAGTAAQAEGQKELATA